MKCISLIFAFFMVSTALAKQQFVFLINATESDVKGGKTADYIEEDYDQKILEKIYPQAQVIRIRISKTQQLTDRLNFWMQPNPDEKEVVGLYINSHGSKMNLSNENKKFRVLLPYDIKEVFAPIVGRFAPNSRIIFNGCSILKDKDDRDSIYALEAIMDNFGVVDGSIYAGQTKGFYPFRMWYNADPLNPELEWRARVHTAILYIGWPIALPISYLQEQIGNRGYILKRVNNQSQVYKARFFDAIKPEMPLNDLKRVR